MPSDLQEPSQMYKSWSKPLKINTSHGAKPNKVPIYMLEMPLAPPKCTPCRKYMELTTFAKSMKRA